MLPFVVAFVAASFFGVSKVMIKKGMVGNAFACVLYTLIVAPPILLCLSIINGDLFLTYNYDLWIIASLALGGVLNLVAGRMCTYVSIQLIGASRASQLTTIQVIFASILGVVLLEEKINSTLALGTLAIFFGVLLISVSSGQGKVKDLIPTQKFRKGFALALIGGVIWGTGQFFAKIGVRGLGSPIMASLMAFLSANLIQAVVFVPFARKGPKLERRQKIFLLSAGTLTTLGLFAEFSAYRLAPLVFVNPIIATNPLFTLLISYLFIQKVELINRKVLFGAVAVVFGAFLVATM